MVTEHLLKTVISCFVCTMQENQFLLFLNHLRLPYSIPKSFALLLAFHCFRHTFATLQLAGGTDIYTVSKLLTHSNLATTQVYAEVVNELKRDASERISLKDDASESATTDKETLAH